MINIMIEKIKNLINDGKSYIEIGNILNLHRTTISKICNENNIIKPIKEKNINCNICGKSLGENKKNNTKCNTCVTRIRRYRIKKKAINYLGGKCSKCGYDEHLAALTFHHTDDSKEFNISKLMHSISWEELKLELDKCIVLCANCHNIEHSKYDNLFE